MKNPLKTFVRGRWIVALAVSLAGWGMPLKARAAIVVTAQLTDLANVVPGEDLWQASYTVSGGTFLANQGFTIFFAPALYKNLSAPIAPIPVGWNVLTVQPDVALAAPGFIDALALVNNLSLALPFKLNFVWLGSTPPASQSFQTYDQNFVFQITGTGNTIVSPIMGGVVPEPGSLASGMGVAAIIAFSFLRRRKPEVPSP